MQPDINLGAVIIAGLANFALGGLWFGPLFGKQWMATIGITPEKVAEWKKQGKGMGKEMGLMFVSSLVMAYVLAHVLWAFDRAGVTYTVGNALQGAGWSWLGFVVPPVIGIKLFEQRPWKWFAIESGFYLTGLLIAGTILASWK
jgi:hypothetical protein